MVLDLILEYWNDALTIILAVVTVVIGYYQVQYYRAQSSKVRILNVSGAVYQEQEGGRFGDKYTSHSVNLYVENDGREPTTISRASLYLPDTDEEVVLTTPEAKEDEDDTPGHFWKLAPNDRKKVRYFGYDGAHRDDYSKEVQATIRLETSAGDVEESVTFHPK